MWVGALALSLTRTHSLLHSLTGLAHSLSTQSLAHALTLAITHSLSTNPRIHYCTEEHGAFPAYSEHGAFPVYSEHGAFPAYSEHGAFPVYSEHGAFPVYSEHGAFPAYSEHGGFPAYSEHGAFPAYSEQGGAFPAYSANTDPWVSWIVTSGPSAKHDGFPFVDLSAGDNNTVRDSCSLAPSPSLCF